MRDTQLVMYDEDFRKILALAQRLVVDANAEFAQNADARAIDLLDVAGGKFEHGYPRCGFAHRAVAVQTS